VALRVFSGLVCPKYLLVLFSVTALVRAQEGEPGRYAFGEYQSAIEGLSLPSAVVFQGPNRLVVAEAGAHRIRIMDLNGRTIKRWGDYGDRKKCFRAPMGLAIVNRRIWVADSGNHRIQIFSGKGRFKRILGEQGAGPGQFFRPTGLAFDQARQRVAVADSGNARVQVFTVDGEWLQTIEKGAEDQPLLNPSAVAFDHQGHLYVVDRDRNVIDRYDPEGNPKPGWGGYGPHFGLLDEPSAAVWQGGRLWVVDRRNHRLQAFTPEAGPETIWGRHEVVPHQGGGKLHYPDLLAISPDGKRAVVGESIEHRLQWFAASEDDLLVQEVPPNAGMRDRTHLGSYLGQAEKLLIAAEPENHYVFVFDLRRELPVIINKFGERGAGFGLVNRLAGLCILPDRNEIWALDAVNRRLSVYALDYDPESPLRFDPNRVQFAVALEYRLLDEALNGRHAVKPRSLKLGPDGFVYVLDGANGVMFKVAPDTLAVSVFFKPDPDDTGPLDPVDFAFDGKGTGLWVVDRLAATIWAIDKSGRLQDHLGRRGKKKGRLMRPFGIASLPEGGFLVTDSLRDVVIRYDKKGRALDEWGGRGDRMGQFWHPQGIAVDESGRIFVIDQGNHRAQIFTLQGAWLATFGAGRAYSARNVPADKKPLID